MLVCKCFFVCVCVYRQGQLESELPESKVSKKGTRERKVRKYWEWLAKKLGMGWMGRVYKATTRRRENSAVRACTLIYVCIC